MHKENQTSGQSSTNHFSGAMHMQKWRLAMSVRALLIAFGLLWSLSANADLQCEVANVSQVVSAGVISVPMGAAKGTTVSTLPSSPFQVTCRFTAGGVTSGIIVTNLESSSPVAGFTDVFQTNVPGLGVRHLVTAQPECNTTAVPLSSGGLKISCPVSGPADNSYRPIQMSIQTSFVAVGTIKSGASSLTSIPAITLNFYVQDPSKNPISGPWGKSPVYTGVATGTLSTATCSVQTPGLAITLPKVSVRGFSAGLGSTAGHQPFNLNFSCASGAQVSIVITDAVDPTNRSNVLKPAPDSTAKGVGVQVLRDKGVAVAFGPDDAGQSVANQWLIGASPSGALVLPLSAQYVRTGDVQPGSIRALATFTMSYK